MTQVAQVPLARRPHRRARTRASSRTPRPTARSSSAARATARSSARTSAARLTLLYGPSGVGKSSVLQAGVVAELHARARAELEAGERPGYVAAAFSQWAGDPASALAARIPGGRPRPSGSSSRDATLADARGLGRAGAPVRCSSSSTSSRSTSCTTPTRTARARSRSSSRAVDRLDCRIHFLISIREDAVARLDRFKGRVPTILDNTPRVERLDRAGREGPSSAAGAFQRAPPRAAIDGPSTGLVDEVLERVQAGGSGIETDPGRGPTTAARSSRRAPTRHERIWRYAQETGSRDLTFATLQRLGAPANVIRSTTISLERRDQHEVHRGKAFT